METITYENINYRYKIVRHGGTNYIYPEYESAKEFANNKDIGLKLAYDYLKKLYDEKKNK